MAAIKRKKTDDKQLILLVKRGESENLELKKQLVSGRLQQKHQIIVVTNNANIVVNGDTENIVALDVCACQTRIICQNSFQKTEVRNEICRVMEGGKRHSTFVIN